MTEGEGGNDKGGMTFLGINVPSPRPSPQGNPPAVIPDIFNRESMAVSMQSHMNEGTEEKDTGFPLTTGGNDRGGRRE